VRVVAGQTASVEPSSFTPRLAASHRAKGDVDVAAERDPTGEATWSLGLMLGGARSVGDDVGFVAGFLPSLRVSLARQQKAWIAGLALEVASSENRQMREAQAQGSASLGRAFRRGRWAGSLAAEIGGGTAWQRSQTGAQRWSGLSSVALVMQGTLRVSDHCLAALSVRAPATVLRLDGGNTVQFLPAASAGALYAW
jgi:hypothetical protein